MSAEREAVSTFAKALRKVVVSMDTWALRYKAESERNHLSRAELRLQVGEIDRVAEALLWGVSVGMYGESQCGKSNLVSRLAKGLGAAESAEGNLCVKDPCDIQAERPWATDGAPGIEFIKWIDPGGSGESTGIVCRFTATDPGAPSGCFRISFISQAELLCALADGYESGVEEENGDARRALIRETLESLRGKEREPDPDGTMVQLLDAWRRLSRGGGGARINDLDTGGQGTGEGWDEFVEDCIARDNRPKLGTMESSDLKGFVSLLWGGDASLGNLWYRLHKDLGKLQQLQQTCVRATDVVRRPQANRAGHSLIDVNWLDEFQSDDPQQCTIRGVVRGEWRDVRISKAALVALSRELVLPITATKPPTGATFDVIDFPGARPFDSRRQVAGDDESGTAIALAALKRGKLNRLFLTGIDHLDCSVLNLVANCGGNQDAAKIVRRALEAWLKREGWKASPQIPVSSMDDSGPATRGLPMVLAMTQVDRLLSTPDRAEQKLRLVKQAYSPQDQDLDWMDCWNGKSPFGDVFWVYNPDAPVGAGKKVGLLREAKGAPELASKLNLSELIGRHTRDREGKFTALFEGDSGADVGMLAARIQELARDAAAQRQPGLAMKLLRIAGEVRGRMNAIYKGRAPDNVQQVVESAAAHMKAIRELQVNEVSGLFRCLTMSTEHVKKAWRRALDAGTPAHGGPRGAISFDAFFGALHTTFVHEFKDRSDRPDSLWCEAVRRVAGEDLASDIRSRLEQIPNAPWFRASLRKRIEPLLDRVNAAQIPQDRLAAVVSAQWNRCMTWLDADPPVAHGEDPSLPTLRGKQAFNRAIVRHWETALSIAYRTLADPNLFGEQWNKELGECIEQLENAEKAFVESAVRFENTCWTPVVERLGSHAMRATVSKGVN
jgi:hypothetical protein